MMFHTIAFILGFLPICLVGFFSLGRFLHTRWALLWLVACSLFFYGWWNPDHLPLLIGSVGLNYAVAVMLRRSDRPRSWLGAGITLNLALLGWFKYADFLLHIVAPAAPSLHVTLPLAISFFTFQQIMVLVDTARATTPSSATCPGLSTTCGADYSKVVDGRTKSGHDTLQCLPPAMPETTAP